MYWWEAQCGLASHEFRQCLGGDAAQEPLQLIKTDGAFGEMPQYFQFPLPA